MTTVSIEIPPADLAALKPAVSPGVGGTRRNGTIGSMRRSPSVVPFLVAAQLAAVLALPQAAIAQPKTVAAVRGGMPYAVREDAMRFADDVAARRNLDRDWVRATIGSARLLPNVPRLMLPAPRGTAKNWAAYRGRFIDPVRIAAGVRFWRDNAATLARAEA